jgi:hypothetical protein
MGKSITKCRIFCKTISSEYATIKSFVDGVIYLKHKEDYDG